MAAGALPQLMLDGKAADFARIDEQQFQGQRATLTAGAAGGRAGRPDARRLAHHGRARPAADDRLREAAADIPSRGVLRLEYKAHDDYGVEGVKAIITRKGDCRARRSPSICRCPASISRRRATRAINDLTAHPWAGLPVEIKLQAVDALGQTGESETRRDALPERQFHHPVARAIIEARKELTLHPDAARGRRRDVVGSLAPARASSTTTSSCSWRCARRRRGSCSNKEADSRGGGAAVAVGDRAAHRGRPHDARARAICARRCRSCRMRSRATRPTPRSST